MVCITCLAFSSAAILGVVCQVVSSSHKVYPPYGAAVFYLLGGGVERCVVQHLGYLIFLDYRPCPIWKPWGLVWFSRTHYLLGTHISSLCAHPLAPSSLVTVFVGVSHWWEVLFWSLGEILPGASYEGLHCVIYFSLVLGGLSRARCSHYCLRVSLHPFDLLSDSCFVVQLSTRLTFIQRVTVSVTLLSLLHHQWSPLLVLFPLHSYLRWVEIDRINCRNKIVTKLLLSNYIPYIFHVVT